MKIYIIKGNNNEVYEDYYEWIQSVYLNKENAEKEIEVLKKKYEENNYYIEEYEIKDRMENINENNKQK
ncbi:hypothetical protein [uncultured Rikenella sp.]|uniref:DUF7336 domain-containing protein n=1 Tax=uncultured Rikenella sp. TaxID=368003 RepID=UPI002610DA5A|nr:hypothetical protein [uncultured Rikenella sp.]